MDKFTVDLSGPPMEWSKLIRLVSNGQEIILTEGGNPIAKITPLGSGKVEYSSNDVPHSNESKYRTRRKSQFTEFWLG